MFSFVPQPLNDAVAILLFVFGVLAGALKSKLEIPPAISKLLSLYLLMALGLKGGFALAHSGLSATVMLSLAAAMLMAFIVPAMGYQLLKNRVPRFDAAAIADVTLARDWYERESAGLGEALVGD